MSRKLLTALLFLTLFPLLNSDCFAQVIGGPYGCARTFLYNDGQYNVYEEIFCVTNLAKTNCSPPIPSGRVLLFDVPVSPTGCAFYPANQLCNCASAQVPSGVGGGGPLAFTPTGKNGTSNHNAAIKNFSEFVGQDPTTKQWFKFTKGDIKVLGKDGKEKDFNFRHCFAINPNDSPKMEAAGRATSDITPADKVAKAWFEKAEGMTFKANMQGGGTGTLAETVDVTNDKGKKETYVVIFAPEPPTKKDVKGGGKKPGPTPEPDQNDK